MGASSDRKESACNAGGLGSIPGLKRVPGGGKWQPTQVFLLEESHGQRSLAGCHQKGYKDLNTTEWQSTNDAAVSSFYFLFRVFLYFSKMPKMDGHDFYSKKLLRLVSCGQFGKH